MPHSAIRALRQRLTPQQLNKAVNFAHYFSAQEAVQSGFLDELCSADQITEVTKKRASEALKLNAAAHASSKLRLRETLLQEIARDIVRDCEGWRAGS